MNIRPGIAVTLEELIKYYNLVIFTASDQHYADSILSHIDPMKSYFKFRLYRNHCIKRTTIKGNFYIKDLRVIDNMPLNNMLIIDNSVLSFAFQLDNGIPILPFYSNKDDIEFNFLRNYLIKLNKYENFVYQNSINFDLNSLMKETINGSPEVTSPIITQNNLNNNKCDTSKNKVDLTNLSIKKSVKEEKLVQNKNISFTETNKSIKNTKSDLSKQSETSTQTNSTSKPNSTLSKKILASRKKSRVQMKFIEVLENVKKLK